jgi:hypothetical protein
MSDYVFVTRWRIGAPIERVFTRIQDADGWPSWWRGVREVRVIEAGGSDGIGRVFRTTWRSRLPYDLTFNARTVRHEPPRAIEVRAFGELEGQGRWELSPEGEATDVTYHWTVAANKWWMRLLAPVARPLFRWNHDAIMRWGGQGLASVLGASFEER